MCWFIRNVQFCHQKLILTFRLNFSPNDVKNQIEGMVWETTTSKIFIITKPSTYNLNLKTHLKDLFTAKLVFQLNIKLNMVKFHPKLNIFWNFLGRHFYFLHSLDVLSQHLLLLEYFGNLKQKRRWGWEERQLPNKTI